MTGSNGSESWQTCAFVGGSAVPVNGCVFGMGDGTGGTETQVGNAANEAACVTMVQASAPEANGATFNGDAESGGLCYAEFGMTGRNGSPDWQSCTLVPDFCVYTVGDGTGGSEEMIGETPTREECVNLVLSMRPFANGATYSTDPNNLNCYAEFGMTGPNDSASWQTCQFPANVGVCEFSMGDGTGGTEERVGDAANTMDCVAMVIALRPDANGATYSNAGGQGCYAEFGMTGSNGSESWQTCTFVNADGNG